MKNVYSYGGEKAPDGLGLSEGDVGVELVFQQPVDMGQFLLPLPPHVSIVGNGGQGQIFILRVKAPRAPSASLPPLIPRESELCNKKDETADNGRKAGPNRFTKKPGRFFLPFPPLLPPPDPPSDLTESGVFGKIILEILGDALQVSSFDRCPAKAGGTLSYLVAHTGTTG